MQSRTCGAKSEIRAGIIVGRVTWNTNGSEIRDHYQMHSLLYKRCWTLK